MPSTDLPRRDAQAIGKLCIGGDWACAHGDLSALRHVAQRLAVYTPEPMHCELSGLVQACTSDPEHAVELWVRLKERLFRAGDA